MNISPRDLMAQARSLIDAGHGRPKQSNLRRAASDCYYVAFHALTEKSAKVIVSGSKRGVYRQYVRRGYAHSQLRRTYVRFRTILTPHTATRSVIEPLPLRLNQVTKEIKDLANRFIHLQELRHLADYDHTYEFYKEQAEEIFRSAARNLELVEALDPSLDPDFAFLLALYASGNRQSGE